MDVLATPNREQKGSGEKTSKMNETVIITMLTATRFTSVYSSSVRKALYSTFRSGSVRLLPQFPQQPSNSSYSPPQVLIVACTYNNY